jgi:hypothetical protein
VAEAVSRTLRQFGIRGCVGRMAQEFGDHPEAAKDRMRWILQLVGEVPAAAGLTPPASVDDPATAGSAANGTPRGRTSSRGADAGTYGKVTADPVTGPTADASGPVTGHNPCSAQPATASHPKILVDA